MVVVGLIPTISQTSPILTTPLSILPVTTVPLPSIENISSIGIRNGLSTSLTGIGMYVSRAFISSVIHFASGSSADFTASALLAEPLIIGACSPSKLYFVKSSLTSASTRSKSSASGTRSTLFRKTIIFGTPTWFAKRMCSLVCGIGPSTADTTRIAPSI